MDPGHLRRKKPKLFNSHSYNNDKDIAWASPVASNPPLPAAAENKADFTEDGVAEGHDGDHSKLTSADNVETGDTQYGGNSHDTIMPDSESVEDADLYDIKSAATIRGFARKICTTKCAVCQTDTTIRTRKDIRDLFNRRHGETANECEVCGSVTCLGCQELIDPARKGLGECVDFVWHCDQARLVLIWVILCGFDGRSACRTGPSYVTKPRKQYGRKGTGYGHYADEENYDDNDDHIFFPNNANDGRKNDKGGKGISPAPLTGTKYTLGQPGSFASGKAKGQGNDKKMLFLSDFVDVQANSSTKKPTSLCTHKEAKKISIRDPFGLVDPDDGITAQVMMELSRLLPSYSRKSVGNFDLDPPPQLIDMLLRSSILTKAAELFRNDSVPDVVRRSVVYASLIDFTYALASHVTVAKFTLHRPRVSYTAGNNIIDLSIGFNPETFPSLADCMVKLGMTSGRTLAYARSYPGEYGDKGSCHMIYLCEKICDLCQYVRISNTDLPPSTEVEGASKDTVELEDEAADKEVPAVAEIDDELLFASHHYGQAGRAMKAAPVGRMRRLFREIELLRSSLPPSIFVRHGSTRLDVMKILIVGPADTPYENGLFEFDLLMDATFPHSPPLVNFRTTGGGSVRFNPNLYETGMVCLSLLGTWQGESWQPSTSTILQILISVQAMILNELPYTNEPGQEELGDTDFSKDYNRRIRILTVKYAQLAWLDKTVKKSTGNLGHSKEVLVESSELWAEVVQKHFAEKKDEITDTIGCWTQDVSPKRSKLLQRRSKPSDRAEPSDATIKRPESPRWDNEKADIGELLHTLWTALPFLEDLVD